MIVFQSVFAFLSLACLISFLVYIGLATTGKSKIIYSTVDSKLLSWKSKVFLALAAIAMLVCVYQGTKALLAWIPSEWIRSSSDENQRTIKEIVCEIVTLFGGFPLIGILDKYTHTQFFLRQLQLENAELVRILETAEDIGRLKEVKIDFENKILELSKKGNGLYTSEAWLLPEGQSVVMYRKLIVQVERQISRKQNKFIS